MRLPRFAIGVVSGWLVACAPAAFALSPGYGTDTRVHNLAHGRVVFNEHCLRCHEQGRDGAPVIGEAADWMARLDQPLDTLIGHAIAGHGDMPARGDTDLPDQDVAAAVAYVVDRTRQVVSTDIDSLPPTGAGPVAQVEPTPPDDAVLRMFMLLMGKDRWK
jgi:cytochrome c5